MVDLHAVVEQAGGIRPAARQLGIAESTLRGRLRGAGVSKPFDTEVVELPEPLAIGLYRLSPEQPVAIKVDLEGKTIFVPLTQARLLKLIAEGAHLAWQSVGR